MKYLLLSFFLLPALAFGQQQLTPQWNVGDTFGYFLSESELIDEQRISLKTYEVEVVVQKTNKDRTVFEAYLHLTPQKDQGGHWIAFMQRLEQVPFTFYFEPGRQRTFSTPLQVNKTTEAINSILLELLSSNAVQPLAYAEISDWLKHVDTLNGLPQVLTNYFVPLDKLFDKYGQEIAPNNAKFNFLDEVPCGDSILFLSRFLEMATSFPAQDTLLMLISLCSDSSTELAVYNALNQCNKLKGLETQIMITSYSCTQVEKWSALLSNKTIYSYAYDEEILIGMGDIQNWQRVQKRIVFLKH